MFALVDSLLMMSTRSATNAQDFSAAVRGRLAALNKAHELVQPGLSDMEIGDPCAVPLKRVIADILEPYAQPDSEKFALTGPDVQISPKSITGIALILHELATNAAKYGALKHPEGKLLVSWTMSDVLDLEWSERGGPAGSAPSRTGFGGTLTRRTVESQFKGTLEYRWEPEGLDISIRIPATSL